ncbi:MAG: cellulase family glycosylhydrolase, partial [Gemmatimonadales bacterium]
MPTIDRRRFVQSLGAAAVAGSVPGPLYAILVSSADVQVQRSLRIAVLSEPDFPTIDGVPWDEQRLRRSLPEFDWMAFSVNDLERLTPEAVDAFINPYGSAFPKPVWERLLAYLERGGNWINLGGVPFAVPVNREGGDWRSEVRQTAYHKRLGITQAFPVDVSGANDFRPNPQVSYTDSLVDGLKAQTVFELYYRLTGEKRYPDEDGSDGPREAIVEPLVSVFDGGEHPVAAPIVRLDRLLGPYSGGRWIFVSSDGPIADDALGALVRDAAAGAHRLRVQPSYACYRDGETPVIVTTLGSPGSERPKTALCQITVFDGGGREIAAAPLSLTGDGFSVTATTELKAPPDRALEPGLYRVEVTTESDDPALDGLMATTGFWIYDRDLLTSGKPFTTDAHTLRREGAPYRVTGTSYMATDVHRRFLLEPNPHVWDRDFAAMKRAGINMIRTGIWTGWREYMAEVGQFNEASLRALDAFLLTSRKYDIPVIFTFFAFIPPTWGGENPYLDPKATEAQKTFLSLIARRYKDMSGVIWDLINEPSFCSPERLWLTRPNYDPHEVSAWHHWLRERFAADSQAKLERVLSEKWRTLPGEALDLP